MLDKHIVEPVKAVIGTAIQAQTGLPERYGVQGDYMPDGFTKQLLFPFRSQK